jgi:hypothetical protein
MSALTCDLSERNRSILQRKFDANRAEFRRLGQRLANPSLPDKTRSRLNRRFRRLAEEILPTQFSELVQGIDKVLMAERFSKGVEI